MICVTTQGMDIPFVPFTFPTVMFARAASEMGFNLSWSEVDALYNAYQEGRKNGKIPKPGNTSYAVGYMADRTELQTQKARDWLSTAGEFVKGFWGDGSYLKDFGGESVAGSIVSDISNVGSNVGKAVGSVASGVLGGISKGLGLPKWILWTILGALGLIIGYVWYIKLSDKRA